MLDYYDSDVANKIITSDNMCEWIIDQSMWDDKSNYGDFENMSNSLKTVHTFYILIHDAKINLFPEFNKEIEYDDELDRVFKILQEKIK